MGKKTRRFFKGYIVAFFIVLADSFRFYPLVYIGNFGRFSVVKCCDENSDFGNVMSVLVC